MAVKKYKPYTPSRRFMVGYNFSDLDKKRPEKSLTTFVPKTWWRNNQWRTTSRFKWGGHKRLYRMIDFKWYDKLDIVGKVASVEYDPYRTSRIALINYTDGEKRYVLAWKGIAKWDEIVAGEKSSINSGNRKQLKDIPEWVNVFNVEFTPFTKGKIIKSAWLYATITGRDEAQEMMFLKLPSGEVRKFNWNCWATIWQVGNEDHKNIVIGKAGRQRWLWRKPKVLWINMNPVDHPHGWWEAHASIWSKKGIKSFAGKLVSPGIKTRKKHKASTRFIVSSRRSKKR